MASGYYDGTGLAGAIAPAMNNLGKAMFGDPTINANNAYKNQLLDMQRQKLDLENQELSMKSPLYDAQRQAALANAANSNASARSTSDQTGAASELAKVFSSGFVVAPDGTASFDPLQMGQAAGLAAKANPNGDVAKLLGGFLALTRQQLPNATEQQLRTAAAMNGDMPTTETAFTTTQADRNTFAKPIVVPDGGNAVLSPNDPRNPNYNQSPLADAVASSTTASMQGASAAPNTISNPKEQTFGTNSQNFKTFQQFQEDAAQQMSLADKAAGLNNPKLLKDSQIPAIASWSEPTAKIYDWGSQLAGGDGAQARLALRDFSINDWLEKSKLLKGAITEKETAQLRAAQPREGASEDVKSSFLTRAEYYARMEAKWNEDNAMALQNSQKQPLPSEWKANYLKNNPAPKGMPGAPQGGEKSLADTVAVGAAAPTSSAIDPDVVRAMEIIAQNPNEKQRVNQMLINAGKPPIK